MKMQSTEIDENEFLSKRTTELLRLHQQSIYRRADRIFAGLMLLQWLAAIAAAYWISPLTWAGATSKVHLHVWLALFYGGAITLYPVLLVFTRTGSTYTRHVIAVAQMLMSALLVQISGGRIETHFHVFGSLAFLAFYRDWRIFIPATIVVGLDHFIRGVYWPQSVYGVLAATPWRSIEHAAWVVFEDIFLIISCKQNVREMGGTAKQRAELEWINQRIELIVSERTEELRKTMLNLEDRNRKLRDAEKLSAIGQLAAGVAHEINNPLGIILGFAQSMVKRIKVGEPLSLPAKSIEREALRCKNLVQNLLIFARDNKSKVEKYDLNETIVGTLSIIEAQARVRSVEVSKELGVLPPLIGDKNQIQQVIVNLCNNAIDAMPQGGKIFLRTRSNGMENGNGVILEVEDNGSGIPGEIRDKIFNPFFTTKEVGKGTGLGLSLVYEIIQRHQGAIEVESEVGRGTTFSIFLPLKVQDV